MPKRLPLKSTTTYSDVNRPQGLPVVTIEINPPERLKAPNAPVSLVSLCNRMRHSEAVNAADRSRRLALAKENGIPRPRGLPGPSVALPLLERLLTDSQMETLWVHAQSELSTKTAREQAIIYSSFWSAIRYAWTRRRCPIAPRRKLINAMLNVAKGLRRMGKAIAPHYPRTSQAGEGWPGISPTLLTQCLPEELALELDHWAPHMDLIANQAETRVRELLAQPRSLDRGGSHWSNFIRLLKDEWPSSLETICTYKNLSLIVCTAFPDESPVTPQAIRDMMHRPKKRKTYMPMSSLSSAKT